MRLEEADRILRRIQKRYDRNPEDEWRILVGRDAAGRLTQIIADSTDSWQIKGEMISPGGFAGVGLKLSGVRSEDLLDIGEPFYGMRPVTRQMMMKFLKDGPVAAFENLLSMPRTSTRQALCSEALIEGPIVHSTSTIAAISDKQRELEVRLNRGLDSLMSRKHPETRYAYG